MQGAVDRFRIGEERAERGFEHNNAGLLHSNAGMFASDAFAEIEVWAFRERVGFS